MLLEARCSLRFTKLEKRSPAMAKVAITGSRPPSKSHQRRADGRRQHGYHDAADGLRGPEYRLAIDKESAAVKRAGKRNSEELLG